MNNPWLTVHRCGEVTDGEGCDSHASQTLRLHLCFRQSWRFSPPTYLKPFWCLFTNEKKKNRPQGTALQGFCSTGAGSGARPRCKPRVKSSLKSTRCLRRKPFTSSARPTAACRLRIYPVSWAQAACPVAAKHTLLRRRRRGTLLNEVRDTLMTF